MDWTTIGIAALTTAFYVGGFIKLTRNHLAHLAKDLKSIRIGQKRQDKRIDRIETVMMNWTGASPQKRRGRH